MDIIGYVFLGVAVIALIAGLAKGFVDALMGIVALAGSIAVAIIFAPKVCEMEMVKNLIEDTPIVINGQEMFYLRTVIVFAVLFLVALIVILAIKGMFKAILKRVGVLKFIDRLLGAVFNVAVVWAIFGIVFAVSNAGTEWLVAIDEQLASSGMNLGLAQIAGDVFSHINSSEILKMVYEAFNPVGELVGGMLFA